MPEALDPAHERLADSFFGALEQGCIEGVRQCYAPDATIWHNFDCKTMMPEESLDGVRTLFANFPSRAYVDVRRLPTRDGLVQQHILRLETGDGRVIDWPGCIVFDFRDGRIARLDEYVDMATLTAG